LDLIYFKPYIPKNTHRKVFEFLRSELPFYRVQYKIYRGGVETQINTPRYDLHMLSMLLFLLCRYTTVFGLDETCYFSPSDQVLDQATHKPPSKDKSYKCAPRPIPACLDLLRRSTEAATGETFNFCLVNYYADGNDSISYHSDDERFLGPEPCIASFSLGAERDFLMKHKPIAPNDNASEEEKTKREMLLQSKPLKLALGSGDCIVMKGTTQGCWLHSIPKRTGKNEIGGRINITFRKALVRGGTENYYNYNVGTGSVFKWDKKAGEMRHWEALGQ
jgi:alkylated DNA repair dioxygenase AlkB